MKCSGVWLENEDFDNSLSKSIRAAIGNESGNGIPVEEDFDHSWSKSILAIIEEPNSSTASGIPGGVLRSHRVAIPKEERYGIKTIVHG